MSFAIRLHTDNDEKYMFGSIFVLTEERRTCTHIIVMKSSLDINFVL